MSRSTASSRSAAPLALLALALLGACAGGVAPSPDPAPDRNGVPRTTPSTSPVPLVDAAWPMRSREHVDLWLHAYALVTRDTTLVPYFRRGYAERLTELRRARGVSTQLDANRATLLARIRTNPELATSGQFLPLFFESWEQMRQMMELFERADGNPRASNDPTTQQYLALLAQSFPTVGDREWLRVLAASVDDESRRFYHDYWSAEVRARSTVSSRVDSLWQLQWRPAISRFLNNTGQQNGELYLSLPLGGEGRTIQLGKSQNAVAVAYPDSRDQAEVALYVLAHEIVGAVASAAIKDNTTPAELRSGTTSRYEQSAAVRAGAVLLERTLPSAVPGYMRYYLQQAGRTPPTDPRTMFAQVFMVPDAVRDAITRQIEVILGGI
jgi:hypothetical protein